MFNLEDEEDVDWGKLAQEVELEVKLIESSEFGYLSYLEKNKEYEKFFLSIKDDTGKYMNLCEDDALEFLKIMNRVEPERLDFQVGCMNQSDIEKENAGKVAFINAILSRFRGNRDIRSEWNKLRVLFAKRVRRT